AQVLLAWEPPEAVMPLLPRCKFTGRTLAEVRRRGWAQSVAEREAGVASVSAPIRDRAGGGSAPSSGSGARARRGGAAPRLGAERGRAGGGRGERVRAHPRPDGAGDRLDQRVRADRAPRAP